MLPRPNLPNMQSFPPNPPSQLTFVGPDAHNTMYIQNAQGVLTPIFAFTTSKSKPNLSVHRILPTGQHHPFFTSSTSSLSGTSAINFHNSPPIEMKISYEAVHVARQFDGPMGKLRWFYAGSMGSDLKLKDENGVVLARYRRKAGGGGGKEPSLEICVPCDDAMVDKIVATGLVVYQDVVKEDKQGKAVGEVLLEVLGAA